MKVIGLVGGIASGKSLVSDLLCRQGAQLLDADKAGHAVLRQAEVKQALRERWGEQVFGKDGEIDRAAVARIVFGSGDAAAAELRFLEQITHPRIGKLLEDRMAELSAAGIPAVVLDAPVMIKAGWDQRCDMILFVDAPRDIRVERALQRGWTEEGFAAREAAQESLAEKRRRADFVIDNSGPVGHTEQQVKQLWQSWFKTS